MGRRKFLWALLAIVALCTAALSASDHPSASPSSVLEDAQENRPLTMRELGQRYADEAGLSPLPTTWTVEKRADYVLNHHVAWGRTPQQWLDWVHGTFNSNRPEARAPAYELEASVLRMYDAVGVTPSPADLAASVQAAARVPLPVQGALADLVATVAQTYAEQAPVADAVVNRALAPPEQGVDGPILSIAERDGMADRAARIMEAINLFHARWQALAPLNLKVAQSTCVVPVGVDCLVVQGSTGPDAYSPSLGAFPDPVLTVDPAGDDVYTNSAGGANPGAVFIAGNKLVLSVVADQAGDDEYTYVGEPAIVQGAGYFGGLGMLVDEDGDDVYLANFTRTNTNPPEIGNFFGNEDAGAQGYGYAGFGLQLDERGNDVYDFRIASTEGRCAWGFTQGVGGGGGLGISSDLWGNDDWLATGRLQAGAANCFGSGGGFELLGLYPQGVGFIGGAGIMTDTGGGDDDYFAYNTARTPDSYGQGYGAVGLGIMYDDGGTDNFVSSQTATATATGTALNCALGATDAGVGILLVGPGPSTYVTETFSDEGAESMSEGWALAGYGLFVDQGGVDLHETTASGTTALVSGRGDALEFNAFGTYLDLGGDADVYIGPPFNFLTGSGTDPNGRVWGAGADQ